MKLSPAIPQLPMKDIDETANFYVEKLGFEIVQRYEEQKFLMVRRDKAEIHFLGYEPGVAKEVGSFSSAYIYPEDIDKLADEFRAAGVAFRYGPEDKPWGMYEMQIDDPCGTAIRFGVPTASR